MKIITLLFLPLMYMWITTSALGLDKRPFEANCRYLAAEFGARTLNYSYVNFQNKTVSVNPTYSLSFDTCIAEYDRNIVTATKADGTVRIAFVGITDSSGVTNYTVVAGIGNCPQVAADKYIATLKSQGTSISYNLELDIRNNYRSNVCPALAQALVAEINAAAARASAKAE